MVKHAHSSTANKFVGASNTKSMEDALVSGFKALQLSTCMCELGFLTNQFLTQDAEWVLENSNLGFCHMPCGAGVRDPKVVLTNLKEFMETNPREVVIIQFDMGEVTSTFSVKHFVTRDCWNMLCT